MNVSVVGLGYIGLPTAAMFAAHGAYVVGVDVNNHVVDTINHGKIHIVEPNLEEIVLKTVQSGYLKAALQPEIADVFLIAVPTPFKGENHTPDLEYIQAAARSIAPVLQKGNIVILESTSPVGTTEQLAHWLAELRPDLIFPINKNDKNIDVYVAYCPERVLPGQVVRELIENDRIIGGLTKESTLKAINVYKTFVKGKLLETNARTAEMSKLTENAFRDVNIAFANELSIISDNLNINVWELIELANHHPRVNILSPGVGVGGHCIAVDPWFIVNKHPDIAKVIRTAREVNSAKPSWVIEKLTNAISLLGSLNRKPRLALFGLAFKPNIDDLRESPAVEIAKSFGKEGDIDLFLVEPNIEVLPEYLNVGKLVSVDEALNTSDIVAILVQHKEFNDLKFHKKIISFVGEVNEQ